MTEVVLLLLVTTQGKGREAEQVYPVCDPTTILTWQTDYIKRSSRNLTGKYPRA